MKKPKVTIVIPVYKGKKYMRKAIDSAIAQTYENLEILVINDGSPDDGATDTIAKSYGDKIRYIYKENGGVSTVLNLALKEMKGEYFSWLSHDDVYYPEKVEEEVNYLIENDLVGKKVILYSDYDLIDKHGSLIARSKKPHQETVDKPEYAMLRGHVNGITLLIPKIAFDECGNFDEKLICAQDYELWYRMMKKGYKFIHIPKILAKSRVHNKQVTNTNPRVETEGNKFWIDMIDDIPQKTKVKLEGSEYNYYKEMEIFLKTTPYKIAEKHCLDKTKAMEEKAEKDLPNTKVSVIIPFYNRVDLVLRAINSVLAQTHKNYELILVNDGSKDDISKIENMVKKHEQMKLINVKPNKGASNARNVGIDNATGDYIAFLDSDDAFLPNKLEVQLKQMLATGDKVSHTSYYREGFDKKVLFDSGKQNGDMLSTLIWSCRVATPTVMIERKYLNDNNFRFDTDLVIGEDTCFWLTILMNQKLLGIDIPLTTVYSNDDSAAYNIEKQIIGVKTILRFVINHPELQKYDYEIAKLVNYYQIVVNDLAMERGDHLIDVFCMYGNQKEGLIRKIRRLTKKTLKSIKEDGLICTTKKIVRKVISKLKKQ